MKQILLTPKHIIRKNVLVHLRNNSGILSSYIVSILKLICYRSNNSEQGFGFVLEKIEWNGDLYFHFHLHHLRLASFSTYWRHCTSYLTFNFITQRHISQITVCCLSNGVNLGKTTAVKCFASLRVALDVRSEYFWFPQRSMSMCCICFICVFSLSLIVHGCEAQRGFIMLIRLSAILVSFHFTLLLSLQGFISEFNCSVRNSPRILASLKPVFFLIDHKANDRPKRANSN